MVLEQEMVDLATAAPPGHVSLTTERQRFQAVERT